MGNVLLHEPALELLVNPKTVRPDQYPVVISFSVWGETSS